VTWQPPSEFEEYRIVGPLGTGAMGLVFLAHDTLLDRQVAIKFISVLEVCGAARERFFTEARAVARLSHPNVVAIHRVGEVRQRPYLVSEYVRGTSLAAVTKPMPWERALKLGIGLARGLGAAHRRGVLHRDIKPANVMLGEDDNAKLLDFGLAKLINTSAALRPDLQTMQRTDVAVATFARDQEVDATISMTTRAGEPVGNARRLSTSPAPDAGRNATLDGAIVGTPLYLAPEIWLGEPASRASDVYALGIVLYELLAGRAPHAGLGIAELSVRASIEGVAPIADQVATLPARLAEVIDRCTDRDPARRPSSGDALCELLEAVTVRALPAPDGTPYRGLSTFEPEHRDMFFGRTAETDAVVERLRLETLVIVAGDSGVGKSSLCRAAVLPAIADKSLSGKRWRVTTVLPGAHPLPRIEAALAERRGDEGLLLFVDQLEELLTIAEPVEAVRVSECLAQLVMASSDVRVLASARSDFLGRLAGLPGLGELVGRALFLLGPIRDRGLREAILGPARAAGYAFEAAATVDELIASGRRHLPLLQFALAELWDARDHVRRVIPAEALARIGGVTGALARHADSVIAGLPAVERSAARTILVSLVTAEGTRAWRGHTELIDRASRMSSRANAALEALVRGRLLVAQEAESGEESAYAIAHEALLQGWDTLRGWLGNDAERRAVRQRVERAAEEWDRLNRPRDALWNERLVLDAASLEDKLLPARDAAFLRAARSVATWRRMRRWAIVLGVPTLAAGVVLLFRINTAHQRDAIVTEARQMLSSARAERDRYQDLRRRALARFDEHALAAAEQLWRESLAAAPVVERAYASTAERLERLLQDAPARSDARELLSDIFFERAQLADDSGRALERDDLLRRLGIYGSAERWNAPARLSIETEPPGASVVLRRYAQSHGLLVESNEVSLGSTPLAARQIAPGSVLLVVSRPGAASLRLPVVLPQGESTRVTIHLPRPSDVPPGFAYVPAGRFLYGSAGGEDAREFYQSEPIHAVETSSYLIALHETTLGEWVEFLRALPSAQRILRTPNVTRQGFTVVLKELPDQRYQLTFGPDEHPYVAIEGEPIRYPGRTARAAQNWARLPVMGVSFEDALAYMAWLRDVKRVPYARPCNEYEWEHAARGADGRAFPHGDRLEPSEANYDLTYHRIMTAFGPDEVGSHPASDSPYGVHDLAGNVWEWTASIQDPNTPAARGGGFFQFSAMARPENRSQDVANRRDAFYGIRVCATPRELAGPDE
jgi:serine/threonine protein kinase/formylglycine-generating enzyme required for sulfatase activity